MLFGVSVLTLHLSEIPQASGWYSFLYVLLHLLTVAVFFYGLSRAFAVTSRAGVLRGFGGAVPTLLFLSLYHFAIAFYDYFWMELEDFFPSLLYGLISILSDSILSEWLLVLVVLFLSYVLFLRCGDFPSGRKSAWLLSALLYLASLWYGRITDFIDFTRGHFGVAGESETTSFLLFCAFDLLIAGVGYLTLFLLDRINKYKKEGKQNGNELPSLE